MRIPECAGVTHTVWSGSVLRRPGGSAVGGLSVHLDPLGSDLELPAGLVNHRSSTVRGALQRCAVLNFRG